MEKQSNKYFEWLNGLYDVSALITTIGENQRNPIPNILYMLSKPINQKLLEIENYLIKKYKSNFGTTSGVVLDVGVGCGMIAGEFAKYGYTVHGVDVDTFSLIASTIYIRYMLQKPYLVLMGDVNDENVMLPIGLYDAISCTSTLEHLKNDRDVLKKLHLALRDDGFGIISIPLDEDITPEPPREIETLGRKYKVYPHIRSYTRENFLKMMDDVGFTILEEHIVTGSGGDIDRRMYKVLVMVCRKKLIG